MEAGERVRAPALSAPTPHLELHGPPSRGRAVLLLPGFGDTAKVFTSRLELIDPDGAWTVAVATPIDEGRHGPLWYRVDDDGPVLDEVARAVASVAVALDAVAEAAAVPRDEVVLAGYSQGGALALATLLDPTSGPAPRAVGVLAGYLAHRDSDVMDLGRAEGRPVLVAHGTDDRTVEPLRGRGAAKALHRGGALVSWADVAGTHRMGPDLLGALRRWLAALAADETPHDPLT